MDEHPPIRVPTPDACTFGYAFEMAIHYDLSAPLPHVRELRAFPRTIARGFAGLAGYRPPPGAPHAPWLTWVRRSAEPVARHRLHYPVSALSFYRNVYYRVGDRTAVASRAVIGGPLFRGYQLRFAAAQEPAFLAFMASYDRAVHPVLRALGPATAAPMLPTTGQRICWSAGPSSRSRPPGLRTQANKSTSSTRC
jgi:hypothetical protein